MAADGLHIISTRSKPVTVRERLTAMQTRIDAQAREIVELKQRLDAAQHPLSARIAQVEDSLVGVVTWDALEDQISGMTAIGRD